MDWNNMEWSNMDWSKLSPENIDWNNMNWNPDQWNGFIQSLLGGTGTIDFCPILQNAVGIGHSFGMAGNCSCDGGLGDGLTIECSFKECLEASVVCGTVGLNVTVNNATGLVRTNACLNTTLDQYKEICFSYQLDVPEGSSNILDLQSSCAASYGGNTCECSIEDFCLSIDCSANLPGAKMDSCQLLAFAQAEDAMSWMPRFALFNDTFDGTFEFDSIEWPNLDWDNLDWNNFGFDQVNWTNVDWASTPWGSLFNSDMNQVDVCPILASRVLGMSEDMMGQGCSCEGELESGFHILCSFKEQCVSLPGGEIAIAQNDASSLPASVCGDVALDLGFDNVGSITANLCVDFAEEVHPITCINYSIPIADQESPSTVVDCSKYESTAVVDVCQVLGIKDQEDVQRLVPRFGIPTPSVEEEAKDVDMKQEGGTGEQEGGTDEPALLVSEAKPLANSGALPTLSLSLVSMAALLSALPL